MAKSAYTSFLFLPIWLFEWRSGMFGYSSSIRTFILSRY